MKSKEVWNSIEGTIVDWEHETQIHPLTGEIFDFHGNKIIEPLPTEDTPHE